MFCGDCNPLHLTADDKLHTFLLSLRGTDLRGPLRAGADDTKPERIVPEAVWRKKLRHRIDEPDLRPPAGTMSAIGG